MDDNKPFEVNCVTTLIPTCPYIGMKYVIKTKHLNNWARAVYCMRGGATYLSLLRQIISKIDCLFTINHHFSADCLSSLKARLMRRYFIETIHYLMQLGGVWWWFSKGRVWACIYFHLYYLQIESVNISSLPFA